MMRPRYQKNSRSLRASRTEELRNQEQLLLQRKREIEKKLNASTSNITESKSPLPASKADESEIKIVEIVKEKNVDVPSADEKKPIVTTITEKINDETQTKPNAFANDGSFMEQFRKLQEKMSKCVKKEEEPSEEPAVAEIVPDVETKQSAKIPVKMSIELVAQSRLKVCEDKPTVFLEDPDVPVSPPEETAVRLAIEKSAISVAMNGVDVEQHLKQQNIDNPDYSWLYDDKSMHYKYFLKRLNELKNARIRADNVETEKEQPSKKRKSRWGEAKPATSGAPTDQPLIQYAMKVFGSLDLTPDQWKQLEDQRKMAVLVKMLKAKEREKERLEQQGKVKYEYDSDEETEGGTWEHKRRQEEMEKTKNWAVDLTSRGHAGHHIGDFLPPEELEKFMQKWEAMKDGNAASIEYSDYQKFKLKSDNVGFQMLQKMGWSEGEGLGASSSGIDKPIDMNSAGPANAGLGNAKPDNLKVGDDEYEAYRKRMMVAYRFRPNPLNNPRRTYY